MLQDNSISKIMVIGVGGGGGNAINDMQESGLAGVEFVAANTDVQDLNKSLADIRFQLGEKLTKGRGAGADPVVGREAAEEDRERIKKLLEGVDMIFITAGMGGGTGTGASPIIAEVAKEMSILTVAVVTKPFSFEGKKRAANAELGIQNLQNAVDSIIVIPNDKLFELPDKKVTIKNAFHEANNILKIGVKGISDLIMRTGLISLDFADITAIVRSSGLAILGFGEGEGENRAVKATEKALQSPLLERDILGAGKILLNIAGNESVELDEARKIADMITSASGKEPEEVMFGITLDEDLGDKLQVTLIANNFTSENIDSGVEPIITTSKNETPEPSKENTAANTDPPWDFLNNKQK